MSYKKQVRSWSLVFKFALRSTYGHGHQNGSSSQNECLRAPRNEGEPRWLPENQGTETAQLLILILVKAQVIWRSELREWLLTFYFGLLRRSPLVSRERRREREREMEAGEHLWRVVGGVRGG